MRCPFTKLSSLHWLHSNRTTRKEKWVLYFVGFACFNLRRPWVRPQCVRVSRYIVPFAESFVRPEFVVIGGAGYETATRRYRRPSVSVQFSSPSIVRRELRKGTRLNHCEPSSKDREPELSGRTTVQINIHGHQRVLFGFSVHETFSIRMSLMPSDFTEI